MAVAARITSTANCYIAGIFDEVTLIANSYLSYGFGNTRSFGSQSITSTIDPLTGANTASNTWTFETWTYYDGVGSLISYPIQANGGTTNGYYIDVQSSPTAGATAIDFVWSDNTTRLTLTVFGTLLKNSWNHIVVQKINPTQVSFYLNGTSLGTTTATKNIYWQTYAGAGNGLNATIYGLTGYQTYLGATRMVSGAVLYSSNFTPNYKVTANVAVVWTTTLLLNPKLADGINYIQNKGTIGTVSSVSSFINANNYTPLNINSNTLPTYSITSSGNFFVSSIFDEVNVNMLVSGVTGTKAKMFSNGVFAIANTGILDEVNHPV